MRRGLRAGTYRTIIYPRSSRLVVDDDASRSGRRVQAMQESEVQELFARFAAPLTGLVALGGRKGAVEELARNLWMVLLAGDQAEERMWSSLAETDGDLCETVKRCYLEEMKPLVTEEQLAALRRRYWPPEDTD